MFAFHEQSPWIQFQLGILAAKMTIDDVLSEYNTHYFTRC